jgi:hypothetical protein
VNEPLCGKRDRILSIPIIEAFKDLIWDAEPAAEFCRSKIFRGKDPAQFELRKATL